MLEELKSEAMMLKRIGDALLRTGVSGAAASFAGLASGMAGEVPDRDTEDSMQMGIDQVTGLLAGALAAAREYLLDEAPVGPDMLECLGFDCCIRLQQLEADVTAIDQEFDRRDAIQGFLSKHHGMEAHMAAIAAGKVRAELASGTDRLEEWTGAVKAFARFLDKACLMAEQLLDGII